MLLCLRRDVVFRLPLAGDSPDVELAFGEGSDRQVLRCADSAIVEWLLELRTPSSLPAALARAELLLGLNNQDAHALITRFVTLDLIGPPTPMGPTAEAKWELRGWRDALDFQMASRGLCWEHQTPKPLVMTLYLDSRVSTSSLPEVLTMLRNSDSEGMSLDASGNDQHLTVGFFDALFRRRTFRDFRDAEIDVSNLAAILGASFGFCSRANGNSVLPFVTYASTFPFGIYIAAFRVRGLTAGIYEYEPTEHQLRALRFAQVEREVSSLAFDMKGVEGAAAAVLYTIRWSAYMTKYRFARAYRLAILELAGAVQAQLIATSAAGLRAFLTPAIDDARAAKLLAISDPLVETPMYLTAIG